MKYFLKEIVRQYILLTNKIWPFSYLNRLVYVIAIRYFLFKIKKFALIKSVYLRPSMATDDWTPGISDIDIIIIVDKDLDSHQEFEFLKSFWKDYQSLQKFLPIFGECEVMDQRSLDIWSRFGILGYEFRFWKLLAGEKIKTLPYEVSRLDLQREYLNNLFSYFKYNFRQSYKNNANPLWKLRRQANKISKFLNNDRANKDDQKGFFYSAGRNSLLARILIEFDVAIKEIHPSIHVCNDKSYQSGRCVKTPVDSPQSDLVKKIGSLIDNIESVIFLPLGQSHKFKDLKFLFLLKDGLKPVPIEETVDILYRLGIEGHELIILTPLIFSYLSFQDPVFYKSFLDTGEVLYGRHVFPRERLEKRDYFIKTFIGQAMLMFTGLRSKKNLSSIQKGVFTDTKFLQYVLSERLFLDKSETLSGRDQLLKKYEEYYPEIYTHLLKVTGNGDEVEKFGLLKKLIIDVGDSLDRQDNISAYWSVDIGE